MHLHGNNNLPGRWHFVSKLFSLKILWLVIVLSSDISYCGELWLLRFFGFVVVELPSFWLPWFCSDTVLLESGQILPVWDWRCREYSARWGSFPQLCLENSNLSEAWDFISPSLVLHLFCFLIVSVPSVLVSDSELDSLTSLQKIFLLIFPIIILSFISASVVKYIIWFIGFPANSSPLMPVVLSPFAMFSGFLALLNFPLPLCSPHSSVLSSAGTARLPTACGFTVLRLASPLTGSEAWIIPGPPWSRYHKYKSVPLGDKSDFPPKAWHATSFSISFFLLLLPLFLNSLINTYRSSMQTNQRSDMMCPSQRESASYYSEVPLIFLLRKHLT